MLALEGGWPVLVKLRESKVEPRQRRWSLSQMRFRRDEVDTFPWHMDAIETVKPLLNIARLFLLPK